MENNYLYLKTSKKYINNRKTKNKKVLGIVFQRISSRIVKLEKQKLLGAPASTAVSLGEPRERVRTISHDFCQWLGGLRHRISNDVL